MTIRPIRQSIKLESRTASLSLFRAFVHHTVQQARLDERTTHHMVLAADEAITSIIRHASASGRLGAIDLEIDVDTERVKILVTDSSIDFDAGPDVNDTQELLERGRALELGVFLIRQIVDQIRYVYQKGERNQLELIKRLAR